MITVSEKILSSGTRRRLEKQARYHGSLVRHMADIAFKASVLFAVLAGTLLGVASLFAVMTQGHWTPLASSPALLLGGTLLYGLVLVIALWESRASHGGLNERRRFAQRALDEGKEIHVVLRFDEDSACFEHEHGALFILDDGVGGSVLIDVANNADDPLEGQLRSSTVPLEWHLCLVGGQIQHAKFSRKRVTIHRHEGLDRLGDSRASEVARRIGLPASGTPLRVPADAKAVRAKVVTTIEDAGDVR